MFRSFVKYLFLIILTFFIVIWLLDYSFENKRFLFTKSKRLLSQDIIVLIQTVSSNLVDHDFKLTNEKEFSLKDKIVNFKKFSNKIIKRRYYLEQDSQNVYLIGKRGELFFFPKKDILKNNEMEFKKITTNLKDLIGIKYINDQSAVVKEILIFQDNIFVSYIHNSNQCYSNGILQGKLNKKKISFFPFLIIDECKPRFNLSVGGNLKKYKDNKLILTVGDYMSYETVGEDDPQNLDSLYGKILSIDLKTKKIDILSVGHRNPQGLFYDKDNDIIFSTEHGPQGGDEINVNTNPDKNEIKNFGWAISSYGEHYGYNLGWSEKIKKKSNLIDELYKVAPLHKSHKFYGFEEPIKYFIPSIGITEILKVKSYNNDYYKLLVASLGFDKDEHDMTLHILDFDNNFLQKKYEKIYLGERIRDIIDLKNGFILMSLESSGSIGLLSNVY